MARFRRLSEIEDQAEESWLWERRIPSGSLTLLDGDPGLGKSMLALDLAARVCAGKPMPFGSRATGGGVVVLHGEESPERLKRRLKLIAGDIDDDRILILKHQMKLPDDLDDLSDAMEAVRSRLVIVNPLQQFLGFTTTNYRILKHGMEPILDLAERHGASLLGVRNLVKDSTARGMARGMGGMGLPGLARAVHLVERIPGGNMLVNMIKSSYGAIPKPITYRIDGGGVRWLKELDLVVALDHVDPALREAMGFLEMLLRDGPVPYRLVSEESKEAGIGRGSLGKAKFEMGVVTQAVGVGRIHREYLWGYPHQFEKPRENPYTTKVRPANPDETPNIPPALEGPR